LLAQRRHRAQYSPREHQWEHEAAHREPLRDRARGIHQLVARTVDDVARHDVALVARGLHGLDDRGDAVSPRVAQVHFLHQIRHAAHAKMLQDTG
jgi:hypothetical protein